MEAKPGQWNKEDANTWEYLTSNYARLNVRFYDDVGAPEITTNGTWYFNKMSLDELIDALTYVREEVYGKR
jgi:hypothetical protein